MPLSLSRRPGEKILVDDNLVITVKSIRGNRVNLVFDGPRSIQVRREEIGRLSKTWKAEEAARERGDE